MADSYSRWVMTDAFANNSQAAINAGQKIEWVAIKTSDDSHTFNDLSGFNDTTLSTATIRQTTNISSVTITGKTVTITGLFNSNNNTADYYIRTMFLVARYNGKEFLAGATVANSSSTAFRMPAASGTEITEFTARPQISVSNTSTISATVNPVASATNERVDSLEADTQAKIDYLTGEKDMLWDRFKDFVTKATAETVTGVKTFTQTIVGSITGNAGTATKLQTGRRINGTVFDGTSDITVPTNGNPEIINGTKTFLNQIAGSLKTRQAEFTDFATVATNMFTYAGFWYINGTTIANKPAAVGNYLLISITPANIPGSGKIEVFEYTSGVIYTNNVALNKLGVWHKSAQDETSVHNFGNETVGGDKTFTGKAKFTQRIDGAIDVRLATFTDLATVAENMYTYQGLWWFGSGTLLNSPVSSYATIEIFRGSTNTNGYIRVTSAISGASYYATNNNGLGPWIRYADDSKVMHLSGNEEIGGFKKFTGSAEFSNLIKGGLESRTADFTDLATVAADMQTYAGIWWFYKGELLNSPIPNYAMIEVVKGSTKSNGYIRVTGVNTKTSYFTIVNPTIGEWVKIADDTRLVHNTGNEIIAGNKTFSGNTIFNKLIDGALKTQSITTPTDIFTLGNGLYYNAGVASTNKPSSASNYFILEVIETSSNGVMRLVDYAGRSFFTTKVGSIWQSWQRYADDATVIHVGENAASATKLQTPRLVGGVSFDGTKDIVLPGVNAKGNQDTSGRAANADLANKAVALNTPRKINGTDFDGTADINVNAANDASLVHKSGDETIDGTKTFTSAVNTNAIEISSGIPFIDFHFARDASDYTSRIYESAKGVLNVNGVEFSNGQLNVPNIVSKNVIKKSMTLNNIILDFAETAGGVAVYVHSNGRSFLMDSTWHESGTLPAGITPPPTIVIADSTEPAGIVGTTSRTGFNIKISIQPTGKISYKLSSLREGDTASRTADVSFDAYTSWFK